MRIPGKVLIGKYQITFSYTTKRNNQRTRTVEIKAVTEEQARKWFTVWYQTDAEHREFRAYSNVKILECARVGQELLNV